MSRSLRLPAMALLGVVFVLSYAFAQPAPDSGSETRKSIPRFLLLISEQNLGAPPSAWWAKEGGSSGGVFLDLGLVENAFIEVLREGGYQVMDHQVLAGKVEIPSPLRILTPANEEAGKIGELFGADYVIVGKAAASHAGGVEGSGIHSATALVNVRVINAKTAEIVATASDKSSAMNASLMAAGSAALQKAGRQTAEALLRAMNSKPGIRAFVLD